MLETNALDYVIRVCISQPNNKRQLKPITFYSYKIIALELNYNIYNKELLPIVKAFKE